MSSIKLSKAKNLWDVAIADAEDDIRKLETAISVFEEHKRSGEPWPGAQSDVQVSVEQHSV
jgi:hypothetical protein